ncbi:biosynthetic peptidoglycan transglycosylase [Pedobacter sp. ISL-64]|uniref:biosynthetic peptidoglycan transglycosylase n=1 Tax=Pedobacter sp. ISL-64 TaxID=2819164 RepID=UPI001BE8E4BA|nr:biosynthetic peptidoglycan transglycosylase [Pedobacter sp. ISL-64]MBT2562520.1 transglycosylase domain-containing protein [Pedobacter sp. ISL-64]
MVRNSIKIVLYSFFSFTKKGKGSLLRHLNIISSRHGISVTGVSFITFGISYIRLSSITCETAGYVLELSSVKVKFNILDCVRKGIINGVSGLKVGSVSLQKALKNEPLTFQLKNPGNTDGYLQKVFSSYSKLSKVLFKMAIPLQIDLLYLKNSTQSAVRDFRFAEGNFSGEIGKDLFTAFNGTIENKNKLAKIHIGPCKIFDCIITEDLLIKYEEISVEQTGKRTVKISIDTDGLEFQSNVLNSSKLHIGRLAAIFQLEIGPENFDFVTVPFVELWGAPIDLKLFTFKSIWPAVGMIFSAEFQQSFLEKLFSHFKNKPFLLNEASAFRVSIVCKFDLLNYAMINFDASISPVNFTASNIDSTVAERFDELAYIFRDSSGRFIKKDMGYDETELFIPLMAISPQLKDVIVLCEDPRFYSHKGVDTYFLGQAMATNIKHKRVVRGGSTITMQLVKNIFLNSQTNLMRKVEEACIALAIENIAGISKDVILGAYLNIIEFGPGIYGLKAGAQYYFSKHPKDLLLIEIIILSYIIPRPIHFQEALVDNSPQLKANLSKYIEEMEAKILKRGIASFGEFTGQKKIRFSEQFGEFELNTPPNYG